SCPDRRDGSPGRPQPLGPVRSLPHVRRLSGGGIPRRGSAPRSSRTWRFPMNKGLPLMRGAETGWSIFDGDVAYPVAVLIESALANNGAVVAAFCRRHGVSLAPHGKTTMAPSLFRRQIADG